MASIACIPSVPAPEDAAELRERARGALLGLAVGDALGAPAENMKPSEIRARWGRIEGYVLDEPAGTAVVPPAVTGPPWAGVLPPRGGWERTDELPMAAAQEAVSRGIADSFVQVGGQAMVIALPAPHQVTVAPVAVSAHQGVVEPVGPVLQLEVGTAVTPAGRRKSASQSTRCCGPSRRRRGAAISRRSRCRRPQARASR